MSFTMISIGGGAILASDHTHLDEHQAFRNLDGESELASRGRQQPPNNFRSSKVHSVDQFSL